MPDINTIWRILTFAINCSQFRCAHLFENIFFWNVFLHTQIVNQTLFIIN